MNTSKPLDQQQHGYGARSLSAVSLVPQKPNGAVSHGVPMGRPLPRAPGIQQQQQQQLLDPSMPTSTGLGTSLPSSVSYQNFGNSANHNGSHSNNGYSKSGPVASVRTSRAGSIHGSQPPVSSLAPASSHIVNSSTTSTPSTTISNNSHNINSANSSIVGSNSKHTSWIQPKVTSTPTSFANGQSPGLNAAAGSTYSATNTGMGRRSQQYLGQQYQQQQQGGAMLTSEEESSYHAALTRPISPTMIMNYIPPPTGSGESDNGSISEASSGSAGHPLPPPSTAATTAAVAATSTLRPHSATVALSSSLGPGSQPNPKPVMHQGARSSYIQPPTMTSSPGSATSAVMGNHQPNISTTNISPEDPISNSARMARRGPLTMGQENGSYGDGTRSRRESAAYSDALDSPASLSGQQYRSSLIRQQPFSPGSQRAVEGANAISPSTLGTGAQMQAAKEGWLWRRGNLLTWKRCFAIGRFRGDGHPGLMTLFKDNEHLFPIKTIDMAECLEVQVKGQDAKATGRFEFKVVTRKEETWFATDTMSERTGWIDALNSLMSNAVGASLMKLEAKLNTIRHRNNSLDYSNVTANGGTLRVSSPDKSVALEAHFQAREQQLSQREQELERKRIESLIVQLEAWRAAAKVTVNQHYTVRDQLLERVMKTARTVQELLERAKIHLDTGSDQITEVVNSHLECLKVHAYESALNTTSYKMLKSILVGLTVNLDTRSSEIKRVLLVLDQLIGATTRPSATRTTSTSSPTSPTLSPSPVGAKERRMSVGPPLAPSSTAFTGINMYLTQVRDKYKETLDILEDHSRRLKRILERADISNPESARKFHDEAKETLNGLLRLPSYVFVPCLPDQPLPGVADTFYREDLVVIHQKSREMLRKGQPLSDMAPLLSTAGASAGEPESKPDEAAAIVEKVSEAITLRTTESPTKAPTPTLSDTAPTLSLGLPRSLSSFLLPETTPHAAASTSDLTQKLRDTILPEFDHLSVKQEESLQSMTTLLNQISSLLVSKLTEIKDATAGQRQEFEDLKDEIIDVMQLSATDPSAHQKDISALSEIRSKLAEITEQLNKVHENSSQQMVYGAAGGNGAYRRMGPPGSNNNSTATATGYSLLQRSASTMVHSSYGSTHSHLQRVNSTSTNNRLNIPTSTSVIGLGSLASNNGPTTGGRHPKIAGMARLFEDGESESGTAAPQDYDYELDPRQDAYQNREVVSKLDQLLLLLEFVNTAQCRMMAYQDLEYNRTKNGGESNVDDGRMMAVQEHMEQMDRKMNLQMHLLKRLVTLQGPDATEKLPLTESDRVQELEEDVEDEPLTISPSESIETIAKSIPSENELSLLEVLNKLDFQVIPIVKDQSGRVQELSDQLSEMKRQLDEQQRRQESYPLSPQASSPPRSRMSTAPTASSSMEIESPAMWRASLRPSNSTGSTISTAFRDRNSTSLSSTPSSLSGSQSNLTDAQQGVLATRTSDRIAEMLDRMDAKMNQMIDEQLTRYDQGNKELLAKVYELLDGDGGDQRANKSSLAAAAAAAVAEGVTLTESGSSSTTALSIAKSDLVPLTEKLDGIEQKLAEQKDQEALRQAENKNLWSDIKASLLEGLQGRETTASPTHDTAGVGQDLYSSAMASAAQQELLDSLDKLKSLIREEADRSESSLNEQRDEILEKMNYIQSSIQESQADVGSRDAAVREELQEMREWIVRHSSMQTENLREIVFAASNSSGPTAAAATATTAAAAVKEGDILASGREGEYTEVNILDDLEHDPIVRRSSSQHQRGYSDQIQALANKTGANSKEIQDQIREQLDMFTKIQMATFSELADNVSGMERMLRDMSKMMGVRRGGTIMRKKEAEEGRAILTQEVKETIEEVMTRMKPTSGPSSGSASASSAPASTSHKGITPRSSLDNSDGSDSSGKNGMARGGGESGIFKYLYQPRRPAATATSSHLTPTQNAKGPMTVNTGVANTGAPGVRSPRTPLSPAAEYSEEEASSLVRTQVQLNAHHDQMEQLYRRRARVEIEVEDLQKEKQTLQREKDELKEQIEQLRREKQEMLLSRSSQSADSAPAGTAETAMTPAAFLEKALADRVGMLLQETAQLEVLKKQLLSETGKTEI
ncbi:MAG: hypothetical protein J3Q66DRAFT_134244 [Benniella sp.]|nr:MAG: hypothetical protein J3Q66DRAFT_134244 [Benniella sp.]